MENFKRNINSIFFIFLVLFLGVAAYLLKLSLFDGDIALNAYNPRLRMVESDVLRGTIYDSKEQPLAYSKRLGEGFIREYPYGEMFAHTVGVSSVTNLGIEQKGNFQLQRVSLELLRRFNQVVFNQPLKGNDVTLTIDANLQQIAYEGLKGYKGAVVAIEPSTGKVLAMVSRPAFDPATFMDDWDFLKKDMENTPLVNRATQGLYPPGSIFKVFSAAAIMAGEVENYSALEYDCKGTAEILGKNISCFNKKAHGKVNLTTAISLSCNLFFAQYLPSHLEALEKVTASAGFNIPLGFVLDSNSSSYVLKESSPGAEIVETAIGQGKTLMTPLHMAMTAAAIANGGIMMKPYIIDNAGSNKQLPEMLSQAFTQETAKMLTEAMTETVNSGTATKLKNSKVTIAAKTGTAENSKGADHGTLIAFAPTDNPRIAVGIMLENSGGPGATFKIAQGLINELMKN